MNEAVNTIAAEAGLRKDSKNALAAVRVSMASFWKQSIATQTMGLLETHKILFNEAAYKERYQRQLAKFVMTMRVDKNNV